VQFLGLLRKKRQVLMTLHGKCTGLLLRL
jgi:hypothetical protein